MLIILASALAGKGYGVDLLVTSAEGALAETLPATIRLVPLERSSGLAARLAAFRAEPGAFGVYGRSVILPRKLSKSMPCLPALASYLRENRPDVLFAATPDLNIEAVLARRLAAVPTRLVVSERTHFSSGDGGAKAWRVDNLIHAMRHAYLQADAITAVSNGVADDLAAHVGIPRERITVLHNPTLTPDIGVKAAEPVDHPWFTDKGGVPTILNVGRLGRQKDHATLIRAFARLRAERPARLAIIGEARDPAKRDQNRDKLLALTAELGVADDVLLMGYQANPLKFMGRADLFVLSSQFEGLPNVLLEALACGCPVVSTDCPSGPHEILDGGRFGRLVPVGDDVAMATAMAETLDAPPDRNTLRTRAGDFGYDAAVARYIDVLLGSTPATAGRSAIEADHAA